MWLMQDVAGFRLHREIAVREFFVAQDREGVVDEKSSRVEHHENLSEQSLDLRLACFLGDAAGDIRLAREKNLLKAAQYLHAIADAPGVPIRLGGVCASHRGAYFGWTGAVQFAQNLARRGIHGGDSGHDEFGVRGHLGGSLRGMGRPRQRLHLSSDCPHLAMQGPVHSWAASEYMVLRLAQR